MFKKIKNWELKHKKLVSILEGGVLAAFFVVVVLQLLFISQIKLALPKLAEVLPSALVYLTNQERQDESLSQLTENTILIKAAQSKADDMAAKGYFAHVSPDGKTPWFWLEQAGYPYVKAGENLAVNFVDSEDVVDAWIKSPTHKANIMNGKYEEIGIATAEGEYKGKKAIFVVQFFGTQRSYAPTNFAAVSTTPTSSYVAPVVTSPAVEETPAETPKEIPDTEVNQQDAESVSLAQAGEAVSEEEPNNVLGAELGSDVNNDEPSKADVLATSPRNILVFSLAALMIILIFKLCLAIHLRHPRLIAIIFTVLILIVILLYINNSSLFEGTIL